MPKDNIFCGTINVDGRFDQALLRLHVETLAGKSVIWNADYDGVEVANEGAETLAISEEYKVESHNLTEEEKFYQRIAKMRIEGARANREGKRQEALGVMKDAYDLIINKKSMHHDRRCLSK